MTEFSSSDNNSSNRLEAMISLFEQENPALTKAINTLGMTVDDYERLLTESRNFDIQTSNSTSEVHRS